MTAIKKKNVKEGSGCIDEQHSFFKESSQMFPVVRISKKKRQIWDLSQIWVVLDITELIEFY